MFFGSFYVLIEMMFHWLGNDSFLCVTQEKNFTS